jgi:radical SAM protein with 4Fe4S-binding SPASM domain
MLKAVAKRLVGARLWRAARLGRETLRCYRKYLFGDGAADPPRRLAYEVTYSCNARCLMCPLYGEHRDGQRRADETPEARELTTEEARHLLEECRDLGVRHVTFTGGEPFLRRDLAELVTAAVALGIETGVITNGSLLNAPRASEIVAAGLHQLNISVDGPAEVHDGIRRVPGMFARIDRNIGFLRAAQKELKRTNPQVTIGCTVSALNQDRLDEIVEAAARWQTPLGLLPIFYSTPAQDDATRRLVRMAEGKPEDWHLPSRVREVDVEALAASLARTRRAARQRGVELELGIETRDDIRRRYYRPWHADNNKCLYPWHTVRLSPDGEVYPCSIMVPMGNVRSRSLAAIWNGETYKAFRRRLRGVGLFPKCAKCCALNKHDLICRWLPRFL